jgi:hypothetical protein
MRRSSHCPVVEVVVARIVGNIRKGSHLHELARVACSRPHRRRSRVTDVGSGRSLPQSTAGSLSCRGARNTKTRTGFGRSITLRYSPRVVSGANESAAAQRADLVRGSTPDHDYFGLATGLLIAGVVVAGLAACFAAIPRGIDLTDESYYIVASLYPKQYLVTSTDFQLITGPLLAVVHHVWALRLIDLVALLGASILFATAFLKTSPALFGIHFRGYDRLAVGATIVAGALLPSVYTEQTPGYDQLTFWILLCNSSLLLMLAARTFPRRVEPAVWAMVGVLVWLQVLVKWPAVVAALPLLALALWRTGTRPRNMLMCALFVISGFALALIVTDIFVPVATLLDGLRKGGTVTTTYQRHGIGYLLGQYLLQLRHLTATMVRAYWYLLSAAVVGVVLCAVKRSARLMALVLAGGLCLVTPVLILIGRARGGVAPYLSIVARSSVLPAYVAFAVVAGVTAHIARRRFTVNRKVLFTCSLLLMPFLSAIGTDNYIWTNALFAATPWVAAALVLTHDAFGAVARYPLRGLAFAFSTLIAFTAVDGTWSNPYRQAPLSQDTITVTIPGPLSGLRVDPDTNSFLEAVRAQVLASSSGHDSTMVQWAEVPGALVAAGLMQPYRVWVLPGTLPAERALNASCVEGHRGVFLLELPSGPNPVVDPHALPSACEGRTWVLRTQIVVPTLVGIGVDHLELFYSAPVKPVK